MISGGYRQTPESNAKRSVALKGRPGRPWSAEQRAAAGVRATGRRHSSSARAKMGESLRAHYVAHPVTAETRSKIGAALRRRFLPRPSRNAERGTRVQRRRLRFGPGLQPVAT